MSSEDKEDYGTASGIAILVSCIGWLAIVGGCIAAFTLPGSGGDKFFLMAGALIIGLSFIASGQMMRAIIDNTNANREILHILKSKQCCDTFATDSQLDEDAV